MDFTTLEKIIFPPVTGAFLAAKIFFIIIDVGVVAFIIYVWSTTIYLKRLWMWDFKEFFTYHAFNSRIIDKDWIKIKRRLLTKRELEFKIAIVDADLLVNDVLSRTYFEGKTLADKLEIKPEAFTNFEEMKEADDLYQSIISDSKVKVEYPQAKSAILAFEQTLKDVLAFREK
jgi:hypothetical protein